MKWPMIPSGCTCLSVYLLFQALWYVTGNEATSLKEWYRKWSQSLANKSICIFSICYIYVIYSIFSESHMMVLIPINQDLFLFPYWMISPIPYWEAIWHAKIQLKSATYKESALSTVLSLKTVLSLSHI